MIKFTSKEVETFTGQAASERINKTNDLHFLTDQGIVAVDETRWRDAQYYEQKTWMKINCHSRNDHNDKNKKDLGEYLYLSEKSFNKVIELGCGPFTNLYHILPLIQTSEIYLLDPLIESYLSHPNCKYKDKYLNGKPVTLVASSIEDFQTTLSFDLVIMENVLQHCKDANKVLKTLWNILSLGGTLIFHEPCFKTQYIKNFYDAGHPLLVTYDFLENFLKKFKKIYRSEKEGGPDEVFDRFICFSGIKEII